MKKLLLFVVLMFLPLMARAEVIEIDGIYYNLIKKAKVAEVAKGTNAYTGAVSIPETVAYETETYNVTAIQSGAFESCKELTSVTISNSVTSIPDYTFRWCSGLTSVTIGSGVKEIGVRAFFECTSLTEIVIPDNVATIAEYAFSGCEKLESITLPKDLTVISDYLFYNCKSLASITIPKGVTKICQYAFGGCKALTAFTIPDKVTDVGNSAFAESGLVSMTVPANVTTVGNGLFYKCSDLTSVTIPNTWISIPRQTFQDCTSLTSFSIPSGVTEIEGVAFSGCTSLASMTIPGNVKTVESVAFDGCTGLQSVTFEKGVETIMGMVFRDCSALTTVTLPESLTKIDNEAFLRCSSLKEIALPNSLTELGTNTFKDCSGMTSLTIGTGLKSINNMDFEGCSSLTSVIIPGNVTTINFAAFRNCTSLASLTLSEGVVDIGNSAFQNCSSLTTVIFPNSADGPGSSSFRECANLKTVIFGTGVESIGFLAFSACENLEDVYIYAEEVPSAYDDTFKDSYPQYMTLHVPEGNVEAYKTVKPWSDFGQIVAMSVSESVKISDAKQLVYCSDKDLDFSTMDNLKAYVATGYDKTTGTIWLTRVKDIPAHTGFLMMGDEGNYEIPMKVGGSDSYYKNMFKGTIEATTIQTTETIDNKEYTNYYLSKGEQGVGFYKVTKAEGQSLGANRAYLPIPTEIPAVGEAGGTETIKVSGAGQVPYYSTNSLDFTDMADVKAYTATGYDYEKGTIWLTRVKKVPALTGILIMAPEGSYPIPTVSVASIYENMFKGSTEEQTIQTTETDDAGMDYINYYLSKGDYGVGFYKVGTDGVSLGANRCYLPIPNLSAGTRGIDNDPNNFSIQESDDVIGLRIFASGTTGIETNNCEPITNNLWYNLQGQRVENPSKGLYIKNGKKEMMR